MTLHHDLIAEIGNSPRGPQVGALFDFDGTLIAGYPALSFIREQVKRGDPQVQEVLATDGHGSVLPPA